MPRSFSEFMDHALDGPRGFIRYESGMFTIRLDPEHEARSVAAITERQLTAEAVQRKRTWIRLRNASQFA